MDLQQAIDAAKTSDYSKESITHVGKHDGKYVSLTVSVFDESSWNILYYEAGPLIPNGTGESDVISGESDDVAQQLSEIIDVASLTFHQYPVAPGDLIDMEISHILFLLFPDILPNPETVTDWVTFSNLVDTHLQTL